MFESFQLVIWCFQGLVGHHQHVDALLDFDLGNLGALFVEQERSNFDRHLAQHRGRVVLE